MEPSQSESKEVPVRYVAFCDILGFSNRILNDFEGTLDAYQRFANLASELPVLEVQLSIYSDAILITAESLHTVLSAAQTLWFFALANDLMIRGAIVRGRYWEQRRDGHLLVVSDALVRAVKLERSIGIPAVVTADDVEIPDSLWVRRFAHNPPVTTPILHFRDRNIVNPFNLFWLKSAAVRSRELMNQNPAHKDKYLWFLALHEAVMNSRELVPPDVFARFVREKMIGRVGE
jgi:hypothetical protein